MDRNHKRAWTCSTSEQVQVEAQLQVQTKSMKKSLKVPETVAVVAK